MKFSVVVFTAFILCGLKSPLQLPWEVWRKGSWGVWKRVWRGVASQFWPLGPVSGTSGNSLGDINPFVFSIRTRFQLWNLAVILSFLISETYLKKAAFHGKGTIVARMGLGLWMAKDDYLDLKLLKVELVSSTSANSKSCKTVYFILRVWCD